MEFSMKYYLLLFLILFIYPLSFWGQDAAIYIDSIHFYGSFKTKEDHLLRAIKPYEKGFQVHLEDTVTIHQEMVELLNNTELFNQIKIDGRLTENRYIINIGLWERFPIFPEADISFADRNINVWMKEHRFDWRRVNIGLGATHQNIGGKQQELGVFLQAGYTPKAVIKYFNPYWDVDKKHGWGFEFSALANKELNVATENYQQVFYKNQEESIYHKLSFGLLYQYKPHHDFALQLGWFIQREKYQQEVIDLYPSFLKDNILDRWAIVPQLKMTFNQVDYWNYPLKGWRAQLNTEWHLPLSGQEMYWPLNIQADYYHHLSSNWYFSAILRAGVTLFQGTSYPQQNNLGYDQHYLRGYEQYVFDGNGFFMVRENIKYLLLDWKMNWNKRYFETVPLKVFLKVFSDQGQYFTPKHMGFDPNAHQWLWSYGIGMDILTLYGLKFRIEYSFNNFQEHGINFHRSGE